MFESPAILLLLRSGVIAVFAVAGASKLLDRRGTRGALAGFGVPEPFAGPLSWALPAAELATALALIPTATATLGALGGLLLTAAFLVVLLWNLSRGRKPACHCFGQLHSQPIGVSTVALDVTLAVVVGFLLLQGHEAGWPSFFAWIEPLELGARLALVGVVAALATLWLLGWLMWQMLQQQGRLLLRLDDIEARLAATDGANVPQPGSDHTAPDFVLDRIEGGEIPLAGLLAEGKPLLLLFTNPQCEPCSALVPQMVDWHARFGDRLTVAVVSEGTVAENVAKFGETPLPFVMVQKNREIAEAYEVHGTPGAVVVRADGLIGSDVAMGADAIQRLVDMTVAAAATPSGAAHPRRPSSAAGALRIGDAAPALPLPDLDGTSTSLTGFGRRTLLLFWNPGCGYCERMLGDLRTWEAERHDEPALVLISRGSVEENRALALRAPILIDQDFVVGAAFGVGGTPMAILLDAEGRVASPVAAGKEAVFALASGTGGKSSDEGGGDGIVEVRRARAVRPALPPWPESLAK